MAGCSTRVAAVGTRQHAGLVAAAFCQALAAVADPPAVVHFTRQLLVTREAAGDVLQMTRDVATLLVLSHAPFLSEVCTRWALLFTVAVVKHWVVALMPSSTQVLALRRLGATSDRRVQDGLPTVTRQLIKTGLPAGFTVSTVTGLLAAVEATVELVATDQGALVLRSHTAQLSTLVSATGALLVAAFLASEDKLFFIMDRCTWDFLGLEATSTSDS